MAGKFGLALLRREANTYRSHGLPEEARDLYRKLLSSSPHLPPEIKTDIEHQLQLIELEIRCTGPDECETLSNEQISVIKQGWRGQATVADILSCAESLYHVGLFGEALEELKKLKHKGKAPRRAIALIAACLIQLHGSEDLTAAVDQLAGEFFHDSKAILSFHVAIAEKTMEWGCLEHTRSAIRHVRRYQGLPPEVQRRIFALTRDVTGAYSLPEPRRTAGTDAQANRTRANARPILGKIRETANFFKRKLRSRSQTTQWPSLPMLWTLRDNCRSGDIRRGPS
jgi:tetratricopeptide (TPR) repeat protein